MSGRDELMEIAASKRTLKKKRESREAKIEAAFVKAVENAGGLALKFTSQTINGVPDRLILFKVGKCAFVELKAPGKQMRPLQKKRKKQLEVLGFPVFCIDSYDQIQPVIRALLKWKPGQPFPEDVGAAVPEIREMTLPEEDAAKKQAPKEVMPDEVHTP